MRILLTFILTALPLSAADWTEFRGPSGTGHYTGKPLPTAWGPTTNVTWKVTVPGKGWSSPIVHKGRVYLTTAVPDGKQYSLRTLCYDAATGKEVWNRECFIETAEADAPHAKNSHASPTPITDGERLYVHFGAEGTAALDFEGNILWKQVIRFKHQHGNGGTPILVDDKLVFGCDGIDERSLVALDKKTGNTIWKTKRSVDAKLGFSFATPTLIEHDGKKQIIAPAADMTGAYDPQTGKELWKIRFNGWSLIQRPQYAHGLVYLQSSYGSGQMYAVKPDGAGDVTKSHIAYTLKKNIPNTPSYLVVGDELYMFSDKGFLSCIDAKTGTLHYLERIPGDYSSSPIYSDGKMWITNEQGVGLVLATGKQFKEIARNELKEKTFATFAPVDGSLYVRTETQLYKFTTKE